MKSQASTSTDSKQVATAGTATTTTPTNLLLLNLLHPLRHCQCLLVLPPLCRQGGFVRAAAVQFVSLCDGLHVLQLKCLHPNVDL
jgi:hypothetical protein